MQDTRGSIESLCKKQIPPLQGPMSALLHKEALPSWPSWKTAKTKQAGCGRGDEGHGGGRGHRRHQEAAGRQTLTVGLPWPPPPRAETRAGSTPLRAAVCRCWGLGFCRGVVWPGLPSDTEAWPQPRPQRHIRDGTTLSPCVLVSVLILVCCVLSYIQKHPEKGPVDFSRPSDVLACEDGGHPSPPIERSGDHPFLSPWNHSYIYSFTPSVFVESLLSASLQARFWW